MNLQDEKCVIVIDDSLPAGIVANTAAILGITLGKHIPERVGTDVLDQNGQAHLGIIDIPVPILKADPDTLKKLRTRLQEEPFQELLAVDFTDIAQGCNTYQDYENKMARADESAISYFGIGICGAKKLVNKLTGSMPLLR